MDAVTKKEAEILLTLLKDYSRDYNASSLSKQVGMTPMGTLKILRKLEEKQVLASRQMGKAVYYSLNYRNPYARKYLSFLLQKEAEEASPAVKRWVTDLRRLAGCAQAAVLFGSTLSQKKTGDVDVLLVVEERLDEKLSQEVRELDKVGDRRIHALRQTPADLETNLRGRDRVLVDVFRAGVVVFGYDWMVGVLSDVSRRQ